MTDWKWLVNADLNGAHRVPDNPGVVESFEARGWEVTDLSGDLDADSPEVTDAVALAAAGEQVSGLRGKALNDALDEAGLSKTGTVKEKQARLAGLKAESATTTTEEVEGSE
jgi:hypothetical protein